MDEKLKLDNNSSIWLYDSIEKEFQRLYDHYRSIIKRNDYLKEQLEIIKSETYKDEELSRLRNEYEKMKSDYFRGFPISEKEYEKINEWIEKQMEKNPGNGGAIGGRFRYEFIPTGIGTVGTIIDIFTEDRFNFQELG